MKTLNKNELNSISGGRVLSNPEPIVDGAIYGGLIGGFIAFTTQHQDPASLIINWAIGGALVNTILHI